MGPTGVRVWVRFLLQGTIRYGFSMKLKEEEKKNKASLNNEELNNRSV